MMIVMTAEQAVDLDNDIQVQSQEKDSFFQHWHWSRKLYL